MIKTVEKILCRAGGVVTAFLFAILIGQYWRALGTILVVAVVCSTLFRVFSVLRHRPVESFEQVCIRLGKNTTGKQTSKVLRYFQSLVPPEARHVPAWMVPFVWAGLTIAILAPTFYLAYMLAVTGVGVCVEYCRDAKECEELQRKREVYLKAQEAKEEEIKRTEGGN